MLHSHFRYLLPYLFTSPFVFAALAFLLSVFPLFLFFLFVSFFSLLVFFPFFFLGVFSYIIVSSHNTSATIKHTHTYSTHQLNCDKTTEDCSVGSLYCIPMYPRDVTTCKESIDAEPF
ncbi:hypothetical protein GE21DRAFT_1214626 [Neurospora crassa]|nr:kinetoplast cr4 related protein [imported] - Neurospora crassa [Neurospora crassa]KHE81936.1 hypothetical protein GE21DRAFT_1214626 [Neurospora crassa]